MADELLIVFARVPLPGACKTRLAAAIGDAAAAYAAEAFLRETLRLGARRGRVRELQFAPAAEATRAGELLPRGWRLRPQTEGDLGAKMARAFEAAFERGYRRVVLVGSDSPQLESKAIDAAFAALDRTDVVLGPTLDGGYYLVGVKQSRPGIFANVAWSTSSVLASTLARCRAEGLSCHLLGQLRDVDDVDDLRALAAAVEQRPGHARLLRACREALAGSAEE